MGGPHLKKTKQKKTIYQGVHITYFTKTTTGLDSEPTLYQHEINH